MFCAPENQNNRITQIENETYQDKNSTLFDMGGGGGGMKKYEKKMRKRI